MKQNQYTFLRSPKQQLSNQIQHRETNHTEFKKANVHAVEVSPVVVAVGFVFAAQQELKGIIRRLWKKVWQLVAE